MSLFKFALLFFTSMATHVATAQIKIPTLSAPVTDEVGMLDPQSLASLNSALQYLRSNGGSQIAILIVNDLQGIPIEQFAIKVVDNWQLGAKGKDDGVLLLVAKNERSVRIEVGRGLEGDIPDAIAKRIINETILPLFRDGDFAGGIVAGVFAISQKTNPNIDISGHLNAIPIPDRGHQLAPSRHNSFFWLLFFVVILSLLFSRRRRRYYSPWSGAVLGGLLSSSWGGGGGFGRGGGLGGGFGGGGGRFGGGGASGRW